MVANRLVLGRSEETARDSLIAEGVNFISMEALTEPYRCTCQTRYHQQDVPCTLYPLGGGRVRVEFDKPHRAISRGQSAVFYDGDTVVGGGIIA